MKSIRLILWISLTLLITSIALFAYKQNLFDTNSSINAERFAHFATFSSILLSIATIVLLYYTYQQTRSTHRITINTFEQTKKDSIDNTFFNLIHNYRTIVERLHERITLSLRLEFVRLNEKKGNYYSPNDIQDKDFFELVYRILHLEYKEKEISRDTSKIAGFFRNYNWVMGHYFRSVLYFIKWVYQKSELQPKEKKFYIEFIQTQLTIDETRLLFYYVISREDFEKKELSKILKEYNFFNLIKSELLWYENETDWNEFEKIND